MTDDAIGTSIEEAHTQPSHVTSRATNRVVRIGIDMRAMQIGHQFRGIGSVARAIISQLDDRLDPSFGLVAFAEPVTPEITALLSRLVSSGRNVDFVEVTGTSRSRLAKVRDVCDPHFASSVAQSADVLIQFDQLLGVPEAVPTVTVVFDQIPLLLGDRYPVSYKPTYAGARRAGLGRRTALNKAAARWRHERHLVAALERAASVVVISEHVRDTTLDFAADHGIDGVAERIRVAHLGLATETAGPESEPDLMERDLIEGYGIDETPFVFFMGGSDDRRRIYDLVVAFNRIRARGRDLKLVLAGYDFVSPERIISPDTQAAVLSSSYRDDIHLLGYVGDAMRHWLYHHAAAYAFPSVAEGFGMPVLEAASLGCPVVAYACPAVAEITGPNILLVEPDWKDLAGGIETVLDWPAEERVASSEAGREWAARFDWNAMGATMADAVERAARVSSAQLTGESVRATR